MIEVAGESPVTVLLAEKVWQGPSIHHRLPRLTRKRRQHLTMLVDSYSSEEQAKTKRGLLEYRLHCTSCHQIIFDAGMCRW